MPILRGPISGFEHLPRITEFNEKLPSGCPVDIFCEYPVLPDSFKLVPVLLMTKHEQVSFGKINTQTGKKYYDWTIEIRKDIPSQGVLIYEYLCAVCETHEEEFMEFIALPRLLIEMAKTDLYLKNRILL